MSGHIIGVEPVPFDWSEIAARECTRIAGRPVHVTIHGLEMILSLKMDAGHKAIRWIIENELWQDDKKLFTRNVLIPACHKLMQSEVVR